jgi:hypothetical protein
MATGQLQVALLNHREALAMATGQPPFQDFEALDLRVLLALDGRLLVAVDALPDHHAWLVTGALLEAGYGTREPGVLGGLPLHEGSRAYIEGAGMPQPASEFDR